MIVVYKPVHFEGTVHTNGQGDYDSINLDCI